MTKKVYEEVGKNATDALVKSSLYEIPTVFEGPARRAFIFRWPGDSLEGWLIAGPLTNLRRGSSYKIQTDDGQVVEFFGNRQIHQIIRDNELLGSYIKVEYIGHQRLPRYGKPRKVYRVWKVSGVASRIESEQTPGKKV